jgi:hypothetical protein
MNPPFQFYLFNVIRQVKYYAVTSFDKGGFGQVWMGVTAQGLPIAIKIFKPTSDFQRAFSSPLFAATFA